MSDWIQFSLQAIQNLVACMKLMDLGLGFSLFDLEVALFLIGLVASAFVAKFSHLGVRHDFTFGSGSGPKHND